MRAAALRPVRLLSLAAAVAGAGGALAACGTQGVGVAQNSPYYSGAVIFRDHCSGCHTLDTVGAAGSATSTLGRLRQQGPNFNVRKEQVAQVVYAIENGGFSGAIMPQNIVTGSERTAVAAFLARYSGLKAKPAVSAAGTP